MAGIRRTRESPAQAALVGVAAAAVGFTAHVLWAFGDRRYGDFVTAAARLDRLAAAAFTEPMEGHVQRMLWIAQQAGRIPAAYAVDPYGPPLSGPEHASVLAALQQATR